MEQSIRILPFHRDSTIRFLQSFNALIIHYLGSGRAEARLPGQKPDSRAYLEWVKGTMMFIFLPVLEKAVTQRLDGEGKRSSQWKRGISRASS